MLRSIALTTALLLVAYSASQASTMGLAHGREAFQINRTSGALQAPAKTPTVINTGDRVATQEGIVQVQTSTGESVLLGKKSEAAFEDGKSLRLHSGEMAMSFAPGSDVSVAVSELDVHRVKSDKNSEFSRLVVRSVSDDEVIMAAYNDEFAVRDPENGNQVAVLGDQDALRLVKDTLGNWKPLPLNLPTAQDDTTTSDEVTEDEEGDEEAGAFFLGLTGTQTAIAGGAGVLLVTGGVIAYDQLLDDDDDDDDKGENNEDDQTTTNNPDGEQSNF